METAPIVGAALSDSVLTGWIASPTAPLVALGLLLLGICAAVTLVLHLGRRRERALSDLSLIHI